TIIASSLWGTSFPAIKIGLFYMNAYTFVFLRFLIATFIMLIFALFTKNFSFRFANKRLIIFLGITNGIAYFLQYIGMSYASASISSLLVNLTVVWVALFSPFITKERISSTKITGVTLSVLGIFLVTTNLDLDTLSIGETYGNLIVIAAGLVWALFIIYNKPLVSESKNMSQSLTWLLLFTMLPLIPIGPFS
ncbi:MAG: DMT family transporter, partial [Candidatus Bathyarchaeota archaeon]